MQHSAPPLDFSSVCKSVSLAVTVHNGVTEKCPHYQGHFCFFFLFSVLMQAEHLFQYRRKQHKGDSEASAATSLLLPKDK